MMTAAKQMPLVPVEDYLAGELVGKVKHEYSGGYVYAMAGGRNVHNVIATAFLGLMHAKLRGSPCQPFNSDTKVRVRMPTHTRFYYPDGMVVCEPNSPNDQFQDRAVVIAEVLSVKTRRTDEGEKREAYLTIPTLAAYLLIETESPRVVAYQRASEGFVARVYEGVEAGVPLDAIGAELSLAELYERVDFTAATREADEEAEEWDLPR
jgi:Uma2 family endonuclease